MEAIKTEYAGVTFRSRLEADWASTLDEFSIKWQYEPEGFKLDDGTWYLPDFYLPGCRAWLEAKGDHDERIDKVDKFAEQLWRESGVTETTDFNAPLVILGRGSRNSGLAGKWSPTYIGIGQCGTGRRRGYSVIVVFCPSCRVMGFRAIGSSTCRCCRAELDDSAEYMDFLFGWKPTPRPKTSEQKNSDTNHLNAVKAAMKKHGIRGSGRA